ncbi:MAG TPA: RluA family pseudouridine synthase [Planctomycetota bacterium]|nr:RluA family pseudouridine synthase [Planctomycetota bacterium]
MASPPATRAGSGRKAKGGDDFDVRLLDGRLESLAYRVAEGEQGLRLDVFLARRLHWRSRSSVARLLDEGRVALAGRGARASRRVALAELVTVLLPRPLRDEALAPRGAGVGALPRLYEDERLIAIDKPPDIPVHPAGRLLHYTVITALHRQYRDFSDPTRDVVPKLCHRLDLETSGVLLVAKTDAALSWVQRQFERRTVGKEYLVLVRGRMEREQGLIDLPLGPSADRREWPRRAVRHDVGQPARTRFRIERRWATATLLRVDLLTGRHHQIRAHMAAIGHPVLGDKLYGDGGPRAIERPAAPAGAPEHGPARQALHSHALTFTHPTRGPMRIESPWPDDLAAWCAALPAG